MKKIISLLLSIIISVSAILFCAGNIYSVKAEEISINSFIEDGVKLIRENDAGKEFAPEVIEDETIEETESASPKRAVAKATSNDKEFSDTAFQTCRLIVKASKTPDKLNSIGMASGFKDWYIVQFKNEKDAIDAYKKYSSEKYVLSVSPDSVIDLSFDTEDEEEPIDFDSEESPTRLNSWGSIETGLYDVKDYIDSHPEFGREITVGVVDVGVDLDNEFIQDRLIRTYFNASSYGEENSEYNKNSHGTMVSSVIVDNTPENVKIRAYKFGNGISATAFSAIVIAMIKAADDNVDIMNCSFSTEDKNDLMKDALDYIFEKNIIVIASAGNANHHISKYRWLPGYDERSVTVAGYRNNGNPTAFTSYGQSVNLMAPGQDVPVSVGNTYYSFKNGTSFSAPMTASLFADMMILFPSYSNKQLEHIIYSNADLSDVFYDCGLFGYGIIDAIGSAGFERNIAPKFSLPEGKYIDEIEVEITAEPGCEIYYSLDGSYPSKESGIPYTEPVKISDDCPFLKAVAYGNGFYRSECTKALYRLQRVGTDDMFEISYTGQITSYTGDVYDLIIPEIIDGITVRSIAPEVFSDSGLVGVTLPDTMTKVSEKAFYECKSLMFADGKNITVIEKESFERCKRLYLTDFPNVTKIGDKAFMGNVALPAAVFPKCKECGLQAFGGCNSMRKVVMPDLISADYYAFSSYMITEAEFPNLKSNDYEFLRCDYIYCLDLPLLKNIPETFFYSGLEEYVLLNRLELSNVKTIESLPLIANRLFDEPVSIVLPSTFESHVWGGADYDFEFADPQAIVYGSRGTYAEQWANENGFEFIEITQETAVINDLPDEFYDYMRYLYADVVGFNRIYQWYGSYSSKNTGGIPIEGANERKFVPKDNDRYPYYYCVVTSTDVGYDPIVIRTGASRYMEFNGNMPNADYSSLDEAIASIPEDLSVYTDESVAALNEIINGIDRNLDATEQDIVDGYVEAVSNAIAALKLKEYTVTFIVDGESVSEYELEYGREISNIPDDPQKTGYTFTGWSPDIPPTMPYNSLTFTAQFEPITYYASFIADEKEIGRVPFTVETESIAAPEAPAKEGYTGAWSEYVIAASDITVNAVYTPIEYTATFTADGEIVAQIPFTVEPESISAPEVPAKEGYTGKWSEYVIAANDITVNAEYTINKYTVGFVADDKTVKSENVEYGSKIEIPDDPEKEGYTFREWLPKVPETMPAKDMTFYAVLEEVKQPNDNPPEAINPSVEIRNFAYTCTVDYRTTISFTAITKDLPKGATIVWYINGQKSREGEKFTVKEAIESFTIQVKMVDKSGNVLSASETELVKVKEDFFSRIIAFFRMLFGKLPIVEQ